MKECKEGIYVIENTWVNRTEKNARWSYIELSNHKTLNMVQLQKCQSINKIEWSK